MPSYVWLIIVPPFQGQHVPVLGQDNGLPPALNRTFVSDHQMADRDLVPVCWKTRRWCKRRCKSDPGGGRGGAPPIRWVSPGGRRPMLTGEEVVEIRVLHRQGMSIRGIARTTGISRNVVRRYLRTPEAPRYKRRAPRPSKLDPFKQYVAERLRAAAPHRIPAT